MKKFIIKILVFLAIIFVLLFAIIITTSQIVKSRNFNNSQTESNLLVLKPNTHYDIIFLGNSHARNFARHNNHQRVEKILNKKILNLGKIGGSCGNNEYLFYLKYCYSKNITADTIIQNIFSQMLFAKFNNVASNTFEDEPLSFKFLIQYINYPYAQNKWQRIFYYLRSKISIQWITMKPFSTDAKTDYLKAIDNEVIQKGFKKTFADGFDRSNFNRSCTITEELIKTAQDNGSTIIFITTPTLFGDWPHQQDVVDFMQKMNKNYNIKYFDFAGCMTNPAYFYDHHHLNTKGVVYFTEKFLKPALQMNDTTYLVH